MIQRVEPRRRLLQQLISRGSAQRAAQSLVKRRLAVSSALQRLKVLMKIMPPLLS